MNDMFVVGRYDRANKSITSLMFVMPAEEELRQQYDEGMTVYVSNKAYKLEHREVQGSVVVYQMKLLRENP